MYYLKELKSYITNSFHILYKWYFSIWKHYSLWLFYALLKIKPKRWTVIIKINNVKIETPNNFVSILMLCEIFVFWVYDRLKNLENILDLWGYIGDSWIFLAQNNENVMIIESDPRHFELVKKNLHKYKNVTYHHWAIVSSDIKEISLAMENEYRWTVKNESWEAKHWSTIKIPTINIKKLEDENNFDWLKMDIEWWEYEIIEYWIDKKSFTYKKWFIEFHFTDEIEYENNVKLFKDFLHFLSWNLYFYYIFDNSWKEVNIIDFLLSGKNIPKNTKYINLYFEKDEISK